MHSRIFVLSLLALVSSQIFIASLSITSFEKKYLQSVLSSYQIVGDNLRRNIEGSLKFGKSLKKFLGIEKDFQEAFKHVGRATDIALFDIKGSLLNNLHAKFTSTTQRDFKTIYEEKGFGQLQEKAEYALVGNLYYISTPIFSSFKNKNVGFITLSFNQSVVDERISDITISQLKTSLLFTIGTSILLLITLNFFVAQRRAGASRARVYFILFAVIGLGQLFFTIFSIQFFEQKYFEITNDKVRIFRNILKEDVQKFLEKGIQINKLIGIEEHFKEIINSNLELKSISIKKISIIENDGNRELYRVETNETKHLFPLLKNFLSSATGHEYFHTIDLERVAQNSLSNKEPPFIEKIGSLTIVINDLYLDNQIIEMILDFLTVLIVSFLFLTEMLILLFAFSSSKIQTSTNIEAPEMRKEKQSNNVYMLIRSVAFIYLFSMDLTISFLPLHSETLFKQDGGFLGLSPDILIGLPISVELFFAGVVLVFAGSWVDRKGWQTPFMGGVLLCSIGALMSYLASGFIEFILYRGLVGLGYGLTWMSFQGYVVYHAKLEERARGLANLTAGVFAGSLCGGAIGGMLAERFGREEVFLIAMVTGLLAIVCVYLFMQHTFQTKMFEKEQKKSGIQTLKLSLVFLGDRNILALLFFSALPFAITFVGFLHFVTPVYLNRLGVSESGIGRVLMVYGLSIIYLGPTIGRLIDKARMSKTQYIFISGVMVGMGLLIFYFTSGFWAVTFTVFILSISATLGGPARPVFALEQEAAKAIGKAQAMGIYRSFERFGQVVGPILMGAMLALGNFEGGIVALGGIFILMSCCFLIFTRVKK